MERNIQVCSIDVALPENLVGSQTKVAALFASSARSFPVPRVQDNVIILKGGNPDGFKDLCRWVALLGD